MKLRDIVDVWKKLFSNWKYLGLFIIVAFSFYSFNVLLNSWNTLSAFYANVGFIQTL